MTIPEAAQSIWEMEIVHILHYLSLIFAVVCGVVAGCIFGVLGMVWFTVKDESAPSRWYGLGVTLACAVGIVAVCWFAKADWASIGA